MKRKLRHNDPLMTQAMNKRDGQEHRRYCEKRVPPGSRWRHYKGGTYEVLCLAVEEASPNLCVVIYRSEQFGHVWSRPFGKWEELVVNQVDRSYSKENVFPRFTRL